MNIIMIMTGQAKRHYVVKKLNKFPFAATLKIEKQTFLLCENDSIVTLTRIKHVRVHSH